MKIACVLANGFEDSEFKQPYDALRDAGHEVTIVGLEAGKRLNGDKGKETATVDRAFADLSPSEFDALLVPGGVSPDRLRAHDAPVAFVRSFFDERKPILAICHGRSSSSRRTATRRIASRRGRPCRATSGGWARTSSTRRSSSIGTS